MRNSINILFYVAVIPLVMLFNGCANQTIAPKPSYYGSGFQPLLASPLAGHPRGEEGVYLKAEAVGLTLDFVGPLPSTEDAIGVGTLLASGTGVALRGSYLDPNLHFYVAGAISYDAYVDYDWNQNEPEESAGLALSLDAAYFVPFETDLVLGAYGPRLYAYMSRSLNTQDNFLGAAGGFELNVQHDLNEHFSVGAELGGLLALDSRYNYPQVIVLPGIYLSVRF